jgi:hypothetical protein
VEVYLPRLLLVGAGCASATALSGYLFARLVL